MGCQADLKRKLILKTVVCLLLSFNIIVGIVVICVIKQLDSSLTVLSTQNLKDLIDTVYKDQLDGSSKNPVPVKQETEEKREDLSLDILNLLKPVVHLSGLDFKHDSTGFSHSDVIRNWADSRGSERHLLYNGPRYENGSLTIPTNGLYFVYSHVKFYAKDNKKDKTNPRKFTHEIARFNINKMDEETVLTNQITECTEGINDGADLEYPSDVRGVLQLNAGDQIKVEVSRKDLMKHDIDWHNFGLYLI